jgi:MFS family permease
MGDNRDEPARGVWVQVVLAAVLMFATLPGRTQGLGLFTEPMLNDLKLDRLTFANFNLWATLIGALLCFPAGYLLDRFDRRSITSAIVLALAISVWALSAQRAAMPVFICLLLTRGFGQSALSVASITWIAKASNHRSKMPMAWYTVLLSVLFAAGFGVVGWSIRVLGWRTAALSIAVVLAALIAPLPWLVGLVGRDSVEPSFAGTGGTAPSPCALGGRGSTRASAPDHGVTLVAAMNTAIFWLFAIGISAFAFVSSGLGLFNESVLAERGFDRKAFEMFLVFTTLMALVGQLLCGWLGRRIQSKYLLAVSLALYGGGLAGLPALTAQWQLWVAAAAIGIAAGMMTVLFFSVWGEVFGKAQLGRIQGAAQMSTVLASAAGPVAFAAVQRATGSYQNILWATAGFVFLLAVLGLRTPLPNSARS